MQTVYAENAQAGSVDGLAPSVRDWPLPRSRALRESAILHAIEVRAG